MRIEKLQQDLTRGQLIVVLSILLALALSPLSKAAVSILYGATAIGLVVRFVERSLSWRDLFSLRLAPFLILLLLQVLDAPLHQNGSPSSKDVALWIPLILIPTALSNISVRHPLIEIGLLLVSIIFFGVAFSSSINYALHMEEVNRMLLESKHVPLFTSMHHIYFGLYLAALIWVCAYYYFKSDNYRLIWIILGTGLFVCLHVLSSRTGLLGFYASIASYLVYQGFKMREKFKLKWIFPALLIPILAILLIPSLKYKWINSVEDIQALGKGGEDLNYKSFGMRVESWKAGMKAISNAPIKGHGNTHYRDEIQRAYDLIQTPLLPENRVDPHDQFIESWGRLGIVAFIALLLLFIFPFALKYQGELVLPLWTLFLFAFLLESVLQRQMGILLFSTFYTFFISGANKSIR